jgi:hypothetical protein
LPKPILCLDFDGVIHSYTSGWQGADVVPDPPVPGAFEFMQTALDEFTVAIYSSRSHAPGGLAAMQAWVAEWAARALPPGASQALTAQLTWPQEKPKAFVTLDDRAVTFTGEWPSVAALRAFRPWNKR